MRIRTRCCGAHKDAAEFSRDLLKKSADTIESDLSKQKDVKVDFQFDTAPL